VQKYHSANDWAIIDSTTRKRSAEGKASDVYIRDRKYRRREVEKEIARHVPRGREWCDSDDALPDYITVCTPKGEVIGIHRDLLLRDLPWYHLIQQMQAHGSGILRANMALSNHGTFLERAIARLDPQLVVNLPRLTMGSDLFGNTKNSLSVYLPPEDPDISNFPTSRQTGLQDKSPLSIFQNFLRHFIFLSVNNLLHQWDFNRVCEWVVKNGGTDILIFLCQLRSLIMGVFARKAFLSAVQSDNVALGRKILQCKIRLHTDHPCQSQFWTNCLTDAVCNRNEAIVELLCQAGVHREINWWPWGVDWHLQLPALQTLLDYGAHPEAFFKNKGAGFPLISAALNGSLDAVKLLLNKGARVNLYLRNDYGTALQAAVFRGHYEVAKCLIQHGADTNIPVIREILLPGWSISGYEWLWCSVLTPVQISAKMNNLPLLQRLLHDGASAMACPISAHPDIIPFLSNRSPKSTYEQSIYEPHYENGRPVYTALQYGVMNHNVEMVALLLCEGVSPDSQVAPGVDDTPLQMSTRLGDDEIFKLLWSWGADINAPATSSNGRTAMQGAAENGSWEIISMLLRAGAQINEPAGAEQGMTALQSACLNGHSMIAGVLLAHGADLDARPSSVAGLTPIQAAAVHGDIGLVQDLIALGLDVNAPATDGGLTALLAATEHKRLPLLKVLVRHGADVNATADGGLRSPLMSAVRNNWLDGVRFLLEKSANVTDPPIPDEDDDYDPDELLSPLGWAINNDCEEMIDLLLQHGADVGAIVKFDSGLGALMHALDQGSSFEVIGLLLKKLPNLEGHRGWERVLELLLLGPLCDDAISRRRILGRVKLLPPLLRRKAALRAWNQLPSYVGDHNYDEEPMRANIGLLLELGVSLDSCDRDKSTLITRTARRGYERSCSYLISRGATINAPAARYWGTPLQEAIKKSNTSIANVLLDHGADINASPAEDCGVTALQAASINGMLELAVRLLEGGADVAAPAAPRNG
ncbi:hypothetical protein ASPSYDRAFT_110456, partial [Aspergillus sydowii CBS 593.65]